MIRPVDFTQSLGRLLDEAFGLWQAPSGGFLDTGQPGLLGSIDALDARTASAELRPGDDTIAAHCAHLLYHLNLFLAYEQGQAPRADWPSSWSTQAVNEVEWKSLRLELRAAYREVQVYQQKRTSWPPIVLGAWMALLAHVSYHVGVIHKLCSALENDL